MRLIRCCLIVLGVLLSAGAGAQLPSPQERSGAPVAAKLTILVLNVESLVPDEVLRAGDALPNLQYLRARGTWYSEARGVFPALGLPGQAALLTGRYPEENGIGSEESWLRRERPAVRPLNRPTDLQAPTLFRLLRRHCPTLETAGVFATTDSQQLFSSCGGENRHCSPYTASPRIYFDPRRHEAFDEAAGHVPDQAVTAAVRAYLPASNLLVASYAELDAEGHRAAPEAETGLVPGRAFRLARFDAQLGMLIDDLKRSNRWGQTVIFLTSTHGMEWTDQTRTLHIPAEPVPGAAEHFARITHGSVLALYLKKRRNPDAWTTALNLVEALRVQPGIQGAWFTSLHSELLNLRTGSELSGLLMPRDLRARSPRIGDIVIAPQPGYRLVTQADGMFDRSGFHGGAGSLRNTLLVTGGVNFVRPQLLTAPAEALNEGGRADPVLRLPEQAEVVDVVPTIAWLLGLTDLPAEKRAAGLAPPAFSGRVLHEAFLLPPVRPFGLCGVP